jgi:hypothetical protein
MLKEVGDDATDWNKLRYVYLHQEFHVKTGEIRTQISYTLMI